MNQKSRQLKKALKKEGLRYTSQRQAIWDEICSSDEHRDVEELLFQFVRLESRYLAQQCTEQLTFW